ncbi:MAG: hypothetical protein RMJ19_04385 [Gemmatales bacterium]|nr:hypothetical protein [Gemmatales bacterium]MDW8174886.1 hypothetical protein [Gemmatales bacterium]
MERHRAALVVGLLAAVTIWGCAQHGSSPSAQNKIRLLEEELASLQQQANALRKELKEAKGERERLTAEVQQLRPLLRQLEDVQQQLTQRTQERDAALTQLQQLRKGVRELVQQLETLATDQPLDNTQARLPAQP